jgi:hypothetical protein
MRTIRNILLVACVFVLSVAPSITNATVLINGTIEAKTIAEKYSLRNLSNLTHKTATFYTLKSSLIFKGIANTNNATSNGNYLKYNKGNISYVIPYRYKIVLPRFKTPTAVQL